MCVMLRLYLKYKPFGLLRKLNCSVLWMCCCTTNNLCLNPRFLAPDPKVHTRCCTPPLYCAKCFLRQGDSTDWRSWTASENIQHADVAYLGVASQHRGQDKLGGQSVTSERRVKAIPQRLGCTRTKTEANWIFNITLKYVTASEWHPLTGENHPEQSLYPAVCFRTWTTLLNSGQWEPPRIVPLPCGLFLDMNDTP